MSEENKNIEKPIYDITKFHLTKILSNNTNRKVIALLGTFPDISDSDNALIVLEKNAFTEDDVQTDDNSKRYFHKSTKVKTEFINNIYGSFQCLPENLDGVKTSIVYPATGKHIDKWIFRPKYFINETWVMYENITLPYITSNQFSLDWVYNILDHKSEQDRVVYEDEDPENGFVLIPDMKSDGRDRTTLHLLAICHKRGIKSIRDLNKSHLPLLKNILNAGSNAIKEKYDFNQYELRMYFHYQPSFYHLHVHINPLNHDAAGIYCEKAHLLETVINNIELVGDYYQKATLPFIVFEHQTLMEKYEEELSPRKKLKTIDSQNEILIK